MWEMFPDITCFKFNFKHFCDDFDLFAAPTCLKGYPFGKNVILKRMTFAH